jgi:hypothetical protein
MNIPAGLRRIYRQKVSFEKSLIWIGDDRKQNVNIFPAINDARSRMHIDS